MDIRNWLKTTSRSKDLLKINHDERTAADGAAGDPAPAVAAARLNVSLTSANPGAELR